MKNRIYKVVYTNGLPPQAMQHMVDICVGKSDMETQRQSNDGLSFFVKTTQKKINGKIEQGIPEHIFFPPGRTTTYTYQEILELLNSPEWLKPFI